MKIHEDDRRKLIDWSDGLETATCKVIVAKEDCVLGNHYHKLKTERFMLVSGRADINREGNFSSMALQLPYVVPPNTIHSFHLSKGSVLIALIDKKYDPTDDYGV